jgi:hypothetical protein
MQLYKEMVLGLILIDICMGFDFNFSITTYL